MDTKHTPGAIKAAEVITGGRYHEHQTKRTLYPTDRGDKTVEGIADLIDRETGTLDMLKALQAFVDGEANGYGRHIALGLAQAAISNSKKPTN